jgi:hypothetical protein
MNVAGEGSGSTLICSPALSVLGKLFLVDYPKRIDFAARGQIGAGRRTWCKETVLTNREVRQFDPVGSRSQFFKPEGYDVIFGTAARMENTTRDRPKLPAILLSQKRRS